MDSVLFTFGRREMEEPMTIVTAMGMLRQCGQFLLIRL